MRILIVGAGIAGLTLAALLRQRGLRPLVVEKRSSPKQAGFVLGLWPLGNRVLKQVGRFEKFEQVCTPLRQFRLADMEGRVQSTFRLDLHLKPYGLIGMIPRAALVELLAGLTADLVWTGVTVEQIEQHPSEVVVRFSDGESAAFDLVAGCDGIHSRVRKLVFGIEPTPLGWEGWGWWVDPSIAPADTMTEYWQTGRRFCAVVPARGRLSLFVGLPLGQVQARSASEGKSLAGASGLCQPHGLESGGGLDRARAAFADMGAPVGQVANLPGAGEVFHDDLYCLSMEEWQRGRVVLVGDACSACFPFGGLGLGASLAMESAAVLADELGRADAHSVGTALLAYQQRRRPRVLVFERFARSVVQRMLREPTPWPVLLRHHRETIKSFGPLLNEPI